MALIETTSRFYPAGMQLHLNIVFNRSVCYVAARELFSKQTVRHRHKPLCRRQVGVFAVYCGMYIRSCEDARSYTLIVRNNLIKIDSLGIWTDKTDHSHQTDTCTSQQLL